MSQQFPREYPSTYFVQDRTSQAERDRLQLQDRFLTEGMGGVLPEQSDPSRFQRVLDVGCGTGGWLREVAKTLPTTTLLVGVDISSVLVNDARLQARAEHVADRVEFHLMDALRRLDFPVSFFDLVNHRAGASYLRTWDWHKLLQEYQRVACPGGVIRVTEFEITPKSSSPALTRLCELLVQALYQAGHLFTPTSTGITNELERLLKLHGYQQLQVRPCTLDYHAGNSQALLEDVQIGFRTLLPFFQKWVRVPENYEAIYQQALTEMQRPDFVATGALLTVWGTVPP